MTIAVILIGSGCGPQEDANFFKAQIERLEGRIEAEISTQMTAEMATARVQQEVARLDGQQNVGAFSGGAAYVLILAIVISTLLCALLGGVAWLFYSRARSAGAVLSAVTSGLQAAKREDAAAAEPVLQRINRVASRGGVKQRLDRILIKEGKV